MMTQINEIIDVISGSPQFRIREALDNAAPTYVYYGQAEVESDLVNISVGQVEQKSIRTYDEVVTAETGDVIFSLVSGQATLVRERHQGYLLTQNYVVFKLNKSIDEKYLIYLLNEDNHVQKQLKIGLQGSTVLKYTLKQVRELELPTFPNLARQKIIGELYFNQMRVQALRERVSRLETAYVLEQMKRISING